MLRRTLPKKVPQTVGCKSMICCATPGPFAECACQVMPGNNAWKEKRRRYRALLAVRPESREPVDEPHQLALPREVELGVDLLDGVACGGFGDAERVGGLGAGMSVADQRSE